MAFGEHFKEISQSKEEISGATEGVSHKVYFNRLNRTLPSLLKQMKFIRGLVTPNAFEMAIL
ncbi:hypothetical protein D1627_05425 [Pontibacter oryzae]|uniref:Uncharacterized protein n=1 Tax=Pontibacter oryzae TaxID=2304593 RepID=A0A399SE52_9BACT|nr:hypothetical protein D1627_05425 [Pontibacter oryzae]